MRYKSTAMHYRPRSRAQQASGILPHTIAHSITTRGLYLPTGQEVQDLKLLVESQVHCVTNNREEALSHDQRVEFPS